LLEKNAVNIEKKNCKDIHYRKLLSNKKN